MGFYGFIPSSSSHNSNGVVEWNIFQNIPRTPGYTLITTTKSPYHPPHTHASHQTAYTHRRSCYQELVFTIPQPYLTASQFPPPPLSCSASMQTPPQEPTALRAKNTLLNLSPLRAHPSQPSQKLLRSPLPPGGFNKLIIPSSPSPYTPISLSSLLLLLLLCSHPPYRSN